MKRILLFFSLTLSIQLFGQSIKISALPTYSGSVQSAYVPIVTAGVTKKTLGSNFSLNSWNINGTSGTSLSNFFGTTDSTGGIVFKNGNCYLGFLQRRGWDAYPYVPRPSDVILGAFAGQTLIPLIQSGSTDGGLNIFIGGAAGMNVGSTADGAGTPSNQNAIIGSYAFRYLQNNSAVTSNGRNSSVGESNCFSCLTPGENALFGVFNAEEGFRLYKNSAFGSNALRSGNDCFGMTSLGAYASAYSGSIVYSATVGTGGHYTSRPTITITPPYAFNSPGACEIQATAHAIMSYNGTDSSVASIVIDQPGCGYVESDGTYLTGFINHKPTITFSGGGGSGATATANVLSAQNTVAVGHTAAWFSRAPNNCIYIGAGSEPSTRYFDEYCGAIGTGSGIDLSISPLIKRSNSWAIGKNAKVASDNTLALGGIGSDKLSVVIGAISANTSAVLDVVSTTQGVTYPRMTQTQRDAIASPVMSLTLFCTDCTATDASTGVLQTYNGTTFKNHW